MLNNLEDYNVLCFANVVIIACKARQRILFFISDNECIINALVVITTLISWICYDKKRDKQKFQEVQSEKKIKSNTTCIYHDRLRSKQKN